jgi:hypothetical protein
MQEVNLARAQTSRTAGQDKDHEGFVARDEPYDCQQCVRAHAMGTARSMPPGVTFPTLGAENARAWTIYHEIQAQVIVGMEVIGLDMKALPVAFDFHGITSQSERLSLYRKVMVLDRVHQEHRAVVSAQRSSQDAERRTQAAAQGAGRG